MYDVKGTASSNNAKPESLDTYGLFQNYSSNGSGGSANPKDSNLNLFPEHRGGLTVGDDLASNEKDLEISSSNLASSQSLPQAIPETTIEISPEPRGIFYSFLLIFF